MYTKTNGTYPETIYQTVNEVKKIFVFNHSNRQIAQKPSSKKPNQLQIYIRQNQFENIKKLLYKEESRKFLSRLDVEGLTPIAHAIAYKKPELVKILLEYSQEWILDENLFQITLLQFAIKCESKECLELLLSHLEKNPSLRHIVNEGNSEAETALLMAVRKGYFKQALHLLELGADIEKSYSKTLSLLYNLDFAVCLVHEILKNPETDALLKAYLEAKKNKEILIIKDMEDTYDFIKLYKIIQDFSNIDLVPYYVSKALHNNKKLTINFSPKENSSLDSASTNQNKESFKAKSQLSFWKQYEENLAQEDLEKKYYAYIDSFIKLLYTNTNKEEIVEIEKRLGSYALQLTKLTKTDSSQQQWEFFSDIFCSTPKPKNIAKKCCVAAEETSNHINKYHFYLHALIDHLNNCRNQYYILGEIEKCLAVSARNIAEETDQEEEKLAWYNKSLNHFNLAKTSFEKISAKNEELIEATNEVKKTVIQKITDSIAQINLELNSKNNSTMNVNSQL